MYSILALWSAANLKQQITYIVVNNRGYGILKERLIAYGGLAADSGQIIGMDLKNPPINFVQLAASMGVPGMEITDPEAIGPAIRSALDKDGPVLLDVKIRDHSKG